MQKPCLLPIFRQNAIDLLSKVTRVYTCLNHETQHTCKRNLAGAWGRATTAAPAVKKPRRDTVQGEKYLSRRQRNLERIPTLKTEVIGRGGTSVAGTWMNRRAALRRRKQTT